MSREQPLEGVAPLEKDLELAGRVPRRVAVHEHVSVSLGPHEDVEALAAGYSWTWPFRAWSDG